MSTARIYAMPRERANACAECGMRILPGRMAAHRATLGHARTLWTRAEYRAHVLATYGTIPAAHGAKLAAMPATGRVRLYV